MIHGPRDPARLALRLQKLGGPPVGGAPGDLVGQGGEESLALLLLPELDQQPGPQPLQPEALPGVGAVGRLEGQRLGELPLFLEHLERLPPVAL